MTQRTHAAIIDAPIAAHGLPSCGLPSLLL